MLRLARCTILCKDSTEDAEYSSHFIGEHDDYPLRRRWTNVVRHSVYSLRKTHFLMGVILFPIRSLQYGTESIFELFHSRYSTAQNITAQHNRCNTPHCITTHHSAPHTRRQNTTPRHSVRLICDKPSLALPSLFMQLSFHTQSRVR